MGQVLGIDFLGSREVCQRDGRDGIDIVNKNCKFVHSKNKDHQHSVDYLQPGYDNPEVPAIRDDPPGEERVITKLCIRGACEGDGNENAQDGAGGWFPADDTQNFAVRLPPTIGTTQAAEFAALVIALQRTRTIEELDITSSSKCLIGLTKFLPVWEDRGWIGVRNKELIKKAAAELRKRGGDARFRWAKGEEPGLVTALHNAEKAYESQMQVTWT